MTNEFGGDWTRRKLEILESYLKAYTTVLKNQSFHLWYVDAFAGTGYVTLDSGKIAPSSLSILGEEGDDETANILKGSARLAVEVDDRPFDEFIFIEQNLDYAIELYKLKREFKGRSIRIIPDDANKFLPDWCEEKNRQLGTPWRGERAVIFLDPFATEVDWQTVQRVSETKSVDLWILFPLSALTRILPTHREPDDNWATILDRVFGNREWRNSLYRSYSQPNLFGEEEIQTVRGEQRAIVDLYLQQLSRVFPAVAPNPKWFHNSRNSPLFALIFAAANQRGGPIAVRIANDLLNRW